MTISDWISTSGDYDQGLLLYARYKRHNRNALRLLQSKKSKKNYDKLKYLLGKIPKTEETPINIEFTKVIDQIDSSIKIDIPTNKPYRSILLKDLPKELHPLYIQQKADYPTACSLKLQLNELTPEQEEEALELCIKIERLFDSIEKSWQIFDHYLEHKVVLKIETQDFSKKSPALLYKSEKNKRQSITKAKNRIVVLQKNLEKTTDKEKRIKITRQIESKNEARIKHEMELQQIIEFINKN